MTTYNPPLVVRVCLVWMMPPTRLNTRKRVFHRNCVRYRETGLLAK